MVYSVVMVVWGWVVLPKTSYMPWYLGGTGDISTMFAGYPQMPHDSDLKTYFLVCWGFQLLQLYLDLFVREWRNDFTGKILHHVLLFDLGFG